jgi:hypothetical protein
MVIVIASSIAVVLIALIVGCTIIEREQVKQDAIYKTAKLAITNNARKADVYSMKSSRYFYRHANSVGEKNNERCYDIGFESGFEACKKAVLSEILKED